MNNKILNYKKLFMDKLKQNQVIIVNSESEIGKTSLIPRFCVEFFDRKNCVVLTQNDKEVTKSVATYISKQMKSLLGDEVGYMVNNEDTSLNLISAKTLLVVMPVQILLRISVKDKTLKNYKCIILDNIQERTIYNDVMISFLKNIIDLKERSDLKVILIGRSLDLL